jgi:hypothetical protein
VSTLERKIFNPEGLGSLGGYSVLATVRGGTTIWVCDLKPEDRRHMVEVRREFVSAEHPPTATLVGVTGLALKELLVEIDGVAVTA